MPSAEEAISWLRASGTGEGKIAYLEEFMRDKGDDAVYKAVEHLREEGLYPGTREKLQTQFLQGVDAMSEEVQGKPPKDAEEAKLRKLARELVAANEEMAMKRDEVVGTGVGNPELMPPGKLGHAGKPDQGGEGKPKKKD